MDKETTEDDKSDKSDKDDKSDKSNKASFFQRLVAYLIDTFLVSVIASFIAYPFIDNQAILDIQSKTIDLMNQFSTLAINIETFEAEVINLLFKMATKSGILTLVTLFVSVIYFIVFQYKNNGKTIGKGLMKIKVVSINKETSMDQFLVRSLIINSIILNIILFIFVIIGNAFIYYNIASIFGTIQYAVYLVCACMIIFGKSKRGVHDLISRTEVIKDNK